MASKWAREKAAQAWCKEKTKDKVMDIDLAEAFAEILDSQTKEAYVASALNYNPMAIETEQYEEWIKKQ